MRNTAVTDAERALLLAELRRLAPPLEVVEIGTFRAVTTRWLAEHAPAGVRVSTVDPFDGRVLASGGRLPRSMAGQARAVVGDLEGARFLHATSSEAATGWEGGPVGLIFIDGDHTVDGAVGDVRAWWPLLAPGAAVALHDVTLFEGPRRALGEALERGASEVARADSLVVVRVPAPGAAR